MGKKPNSKIHNMFSDWHWKLKSIDPKYDILYMTDIDRMFIESDPKTGRPVLCIMDLKWMKNGDSITWTEKAVYNIFERVGFNVYTIYIDKKFNNFHVYDNDGCVAKFKELDFADWLLKKRKISDTIKKSLLSKNLSKVTDLNAIKGRILSGKASPDDANNLLNYVSKIENMLDKVDKNGVKNDEDWRCAINVA